MRRLISRVLATAAVIIGLGVGMSSLPATASPVSTADSSSASAPVMTPASMSADWWW